MWVSLFILDQVSSIRNLPQNGLSIFLGFGLLANGVIRIVTGLKKKEEESYDVSSIALGVLITSLAILVLVYPKLGVVLTSCHDYYSPC